jgi:hypothetical protein
VALQDLDAAALRAQGGRHPRGPERDGLVKGPSLMSLVSAATGARMS